MNNITKNNEVFDRKSFIKFVESLSQELRNGADWENKTLEDFLKALSAYTNDAQGYYNNTNQNINADLPTWKLFADLLIGATIYE